MSWHWSIFPHVTVTLLAPGQFSQCKCSHPEEKKFFSYTFNNNNVGFTSNVAFVINNAAKIGWQRVIPACITLHPSHVSTPKCVPFVRSPHTWHSSSSSPTSSTSGLSNRKQYSWTEIHTWWQVQYKNVQCRTYTALKEICAIFP